MIEFKYATELVNAFSGEYSVNIMMNLHGREISFERLGELSHVSLDDLSEQLDAFAHAGIVIRENRGRVEYVSVNPKMGLLVGNFLRNKGCFGDDSGNN